MYGLNEFSEPQTVNIIFHFVGYSKDWPFSERNWVKVTYSGYAKRIHSIKKKKNQNCHPKGSWVHC